MINNDVPSRCSSCKRIVFPEKFRDGPVQAACGAYKIQTPTPWLPNEDGYNAPPAWCPLNQNKDEHTIQQAIDLAVQYGAIDGEHHKMWVIDQMVRVLAGDAYNEVIADAKSGEDGPDTYRWDIGIAP